MMKVDVVIPVFRPDFRLEIILDRLEKQTVEVRKIYLLITWEVERDKDIGIDTGRHKTLCLHWISIKDFDNGTSRDEFMRTSDADAVLFMTQDSIPKTKDMLEKLMRALRKKEGIAAAYARHIPYHNASLIEKITRYLNYPPTGGEVRKRDMDRRGVAALMCSNACALYVRSAYMHTEGFGRRILFAEDMICAYHLLHHGYGVVYCSEAKIFHSHDLNAKALFRRYFDIGASHAMNKSVFMGSHVKKTGRYYVRAVMERLMGNGAFSLIPMLVFQCMIKYSAYQMGLHYRFLPKRVREACSNYKYFWRRKAL